MKKNTEKYEHRSYSIMKPTPDDWYPTFPDGMVQVRVSESLDGSQLHTSVWGADDDYLERYEPNQPGLYEKRIAEVTQWGIVTKKGLEDQGFTIY